MRDVHTRRHRRRAIGGVCALARIVGGCITEARIPGALPIAGAAIILVAAAILASLMLGCAHVEADSCLE